MDIALQVDRFHENFESEDADDSEDTQDISSKAPDPDEMWPPFGLFGSQKAKEVLGVECRAIPQFVETLENHPSMDAVTSYVVDDAAAMIRKTSSKPVATHHVSSIHNMSMSAAPVKSSRETSHTAPQIRQTNADAEKSDEAIPSVSTAAIVSVKARICAVPAQRSDNPPKLHMPAQTEHTKAMLKSPSAEPMSAKCECMSCTLGPNVQMPAMSTFVRQQMLVSSVDACLANHYPRFAGTCVLASETTKPAGNNSMDLS
jgi:hypothetical protein